MFYSYNHSPIVIQTRTDNDLQKRGQIRMKGMNNDDVVVVVDGELILALENKFYIVHRLCIFEEKKPKCGKKPLSLQCYTVYGYNIIQRFATTHSGADVLYL